MYVIPTSIILWKPFLSKMFLESRWTDVYSNKQKISIEIEWEHFQSRDEIFLFMPYTPCGHIGRKKINTSISEDFWWSDINNMHSHLSLVSPRLDTCWWTIKDFFIVYITIRYQLQNEVEDMNEMKIIQLKFEKISNQ